MRNRFTIDTDIVFDGEPDQDSPLSPLSPEEPEGQGQKEGQGRGEVQAGDTDRWVEEQFDLERYEEEQEAQQETQVKGGGDVKETDILSDDDDFCQSVGGPSTEPPSTTDLEGPVGALSLGEECKEVGPKHLQPQGATGTTTPGMRLSHLGKQCPLVGVSVDDQGSRGEAKDIWVRREDCPPDSSELD